MEGLEPGRLNEKRNNEVSPMSTAVIGQEEVESA